MEHSALGGFYYATVFDAPSGRDLKVSVGFPTVPGTFMGAKAP
jgi:hypothetical protein